MTPPTTPDVDEVHPATRLDETVHQRTRLGILALLDETGRADFPYLRSALQLTDGNLGRHLEVLAAEGLVELTKGYDGKRPRTWVELTELGAGAFAAELAAMKAIIARVENGAERRRRVRP